MKTRRRRPKAPSPFLFAELFLASCETVARRTWMMSRGTCSAAEYARMSREKAEAAAASGLAMARGASASAVLAPWKKRAAANARRLRRKKG